MARRALAFCLVFPALYLCALSSAFGASEGLTCLCNNTEAGKYDSASCGNNTQCSTLSGGVCATIRYRDQLTGNFGTEHKCIEADLGGVQKFLCEINDGVTKYACCNGSNFCNADLTVWLQQEMPSPQPSDTSDSSSTVSRPTEVVTPTPLAPTTVTETPNTEGVKCYCHDAQRGDLQCASNDDTCTVSSPNRCAVQLYRTGDVVATSFFCLTEQNADQVTFICNQLNTDNSVTKCCEDGDFCNKFLNPTLPPIKPVPPELSPTSATSTTKTLTQSPNAQGPSMEKEDTSQNLYVWITIPILALGLFLFAVIAVLFLATFIQFRRSRKLLLSNRSSNSSVHVCLCKDPAHSCTCNNRVKMFTE